ncbi:hypothetical protein KP509_31G030600 [Ceratopteris richardii]|nr:hypothetical protein KP509_31G030600 [Ceratopteris richardii]
MHLDDCMEDDLVMSKRRKNSDGSFQKGHHEFSDLIFEKLHSIEAAPYSLESGRQSGLVLTRLKISISTGNLSEHYLSLLTHAMVGIIFNPFGLLWDVAVDCLSGLLGTGKIAVWDTYAYYLETFLRQFQSLKEELATDGPVNHAEFKDYSLSSRMKSCLHDEGESTDVGTMVTLLLKAAQKVPTMAEGRTRQLVPLFLTFVGHASHDSHLERTSGEIKHSCRGKDWKLVLKEWLILLSNMRNAVSYFKSSIVKEVLINRFLIDADPDIQLKSLECVLNWKDSYLTVYEDHLKNLILPKKVREELTTWNVGKEGENIQLGHRDGLLHILLRILFPKILKTKTRLHNKTTGGVQRKAVLGFLSALEAHELSLFFILILKPLENAFTKDGMSYIQADRAWEVAIKEGVHNDFIGWVDVEEITKLTHKKKAGFLHMLKDILDTFDKDHVRPYLHALLAFCFSILHTCQVNIMTTTASADQAQDAGKKDIRTLCFKVLAVVFSKYDDAEFCPLYWDRFFGTVQPMISRFGDEGASGDAPSALFSCFLSMSRSLALASILLQNENVIPNVLSLISHKNASISVIGASLSFVENLLALNQENASLLTTYFLPHLPLLLSNLMGLLSAQRKGSRSFSPATKRGLFILLKVSRQINRVSDINQLVEVLLPFLQKHEKKRQGVVEEIVDVLHVLEELGPNLSEENCNRTFPFFSQLLAFSSDLDVRLAICRILFAFASANSSLCFIANLISDLNSMSSSTVGEYDYERRIEAYGRLTVVSFVEMTYEQVHLVIAQSSYDLQSDDLSIRHCASNCISLFVQFLSSKCNSNKVCGGGNDPNGGEVDIDRWGMICESTKTSLSVVWDPEAVTMAVQKLLLPNVRKAMNLASLPVRREWVSLLRNMVLNLPEVPPFGELVALTNTDLEVDFFHNITHIQTHRRIRAMSRFKELCSTGRFSQGTLVRVFEPLFTHSLSEGKGDKDGNLVQSAVETIACIATQLQWDPYYGLLMKLFRMVSSEAGLEKTMIRLLCAVLDSFHFNEGVEGRLEKTIDAHDSCMLEVPHNKDNCSIPDQILKQLKSHILPEFMKLMVSKGNIVNVSVSVAIVKVLQLMPSDTMELELPRVILNIVNRLKSRNHVIRDEARAGLVAVASTLGARYFGFVVEKLEESLRRGFELHVLGFTLNALILKIFSKLKVGEIDYCAGKILGLLLNDIFDEVSEEKEVEKMAGKMKEIKRSGSYESLKLVAEFISFDVHSVTIFQAVRKRLKDTLDAKTKGKIERVLRQLAVGIEQNLSLKQEQLFVFVHGLVEHGVTQEDSEKKLSFPDGRSVTNLPGDGGVEENIPNYYLVTEFALHLLEVHLKRAKLNNEDPSLLALLDPVFTLLQRCIESRHTGVLGLALKCLCHLVSVPLQGIARSGGAFLDRVIAIAQRFERTENPVAQPCFNLLVSLLKHAKCLHVSEDQLRTLLQFPVFISLDKAESNMGLQLLKAIVSRKLLVPELYDIINTVSKLMVTSHVPSIQQYCRQIMLQFLLDYPLGSRRLQQHLDFLVVNLSYVNATGREAVLEMLHAVIVKFPAQAIDEQFETVFLPLVTRLLNDDSNQLRLMIGSILKLLIKRISHRSLQRVLQFCFSWLREDKHHLWRAAGQVLGFMVEVMEAKYLTYLKDTLMLSYRILDHVLEVNGAEKRRIATDIGPVLWQEAYCILTLVEKLMKQFPDVMLEKSNEGLWEILVLLLLHQHAWVRKSSSRLLDMYFVASGASNGIKEAMPMKLNTQQPFLLQPSRLMQIFAILSLQLDSELDEDLASLLEKNLFFSISTLHRFFHGKDKLSWMDVVHEKDSEAQGRAREALDMLKVEDLMLKEFCRLPQMNNFHRVSAIPGNSMKETLDIKYYGLYPIFKTLEKIALKSNDLQMTTVFHLYDGLLIHLGKDGVQPYLCSMLCPLHRTSESTTARTVSAELRTLAEAVLGRIRETVGFEDFVHAYNETRKKTKDIRETRKRAKKLKVLLDPMAHAKRKIKLNAKRQIQKRKKRMDIHLQQR